MRKIWIIGLFLLCCSLTGLGDNYRNYILAGPDMRQIDKRGKHSLLVCAANLEYYLVNNLGTGFGPDNKKEHTTQRIKTRKALALINADLYGLCEIEQGTAALKEICTDLNAAHKNRRYTYVDNKTSSAAGSYTMSAFVYDSLKVRPIGECKKINTEVQNRKYMQCFQERASGETFIFSMNHFKSMSGGGDSESRRVAEARAVNSAYDEYKIYCDDEDLLIMGDLNCYYGDAPVSILLNSGARTDLHRYFHADSSYSYCYQGHYDYLDHAICNVTLLPQITGMQAFHCNSRESYRCEYQYGDTTLFRYSDHDPILVGLRLNSALTNDIEVVNFGDCLQVHYADGGYVRIYDRSGNLLHQEAITWEDYSVALPANYHGCYIVHVFYNGTNRILKYIRP